MTPRLLFYIGLTCILLSAVWFGISALSGGRIQLGRLPGDILIQRNGFSFYLPVTTCLLASALVSLLWRVFRS